MPLQNRITPFGEILAISQRGLLTGNRGIIHDPATKTLLNRRWSSRTWLICQREFKGCHREVMARRSWTELFFLDEAVALAAGHRPCFYCRRTAAERYRTCWAAAKQQAPPLAPRIDAELHAERLKDGRKRLHPVTSCLSDLPDGAMVAANGDAYTLYGGFAHRWTNEGYQKPELLRQVDWLLTPPSTVLVLRAGYQPIYHPSLITHSCRP
ncbi:hypothetical protein B0E33_18760 [Roseibium algicola]|uniref:Uncharacterized protein n=1 Tax=Roseibium algicola TaxID=2857014 RepID=A0ABM6I4S5_9HYPH|nr:hypothetical protein [Roseibium aggregatum]AQQ05368.1 hypothetical protein B0E33_18760 [Roseibium aggregatum]